MPTLPKMTVPLKTIGKERNNSSSLTDSNDSHDDEEFYDLSDIPFGLQKQGEVFSDEQKIMSWNLSETNDLMVDIYCLEHVNLWDSLQFNNVFINAQGPVILGGEIGCLENMVVKAYSLICAKQVHCGQNLVIETTAALGFLEPVVCTNSVIQSGAIYQSASFEAKEKAEFTCILYSISNDCELLSPLFRLVATDASMAGQIKITEKCFIVVNSLSFGLSDFTTKVFLSGEIYIKADCFSGFGATEIKINANDQRSIIKINGHLRCDNEVLFVINNATLNFDTFSLEGGLSCTGSEVGCNKMVNSGIFYFSQGNFAIHDSLSVLEGGIFTISQSHAFIYENGSVNGKITYLDSTIVGKKQFVIRGELTVSDTNLCLTDELSASPKSILKMDNSSIELGKKLGLRSPLEINKTQVNAPIVMCTDLIGKDYLFNSSVQLSLIGTLNLVKGQIYANTLTLKGAMILDDARIRSRRLDIRSDNGHINNLRLRTSYLSIVGGNTDEALRFAHSVMTTQHFSSQKCLTLELTTLNMMGNNTSVQSLGDSVTLIKSRIISKKPIIQEGSLNLQKHSSISAPMVLAQGKITSDYSAIFSERVTQIQGAFKAKHTNLYLSEQFAAMQAEILLADDSKCMAPTVNFLTNTQAVINNNSTILAQDEVTVEKLSVTDSTLITPKITTHGETQINHSLLALEDLQIYNSFDLVNQSQLSAEGLIAVARDSLFTVNDSKVQAKSMGISGQLTLSDALINVDEALKVTGEGELVLKPGTIIMSERLAVMGQMHVTQEDMSEEKAAQTVPAQLRINDTFLINSEAKIDGNAPLIAEVNRFLNFGSIHLSNSLTSKGGFFYNSGDLEADTIYLGYDDAVVNTGMIAANNLVIHSNFINPFGRVYVKEAMNSSGFFGLNLGLICANNYSNTTLFSGNFGLVLPNLSADLKYIFSASNLFNASQTIATTMLPGYSNLINFACMLPGAIQAADSFYDLYKTKSFDEIKNMRLHEWMPIVGQLNGLGTLGFNTIKTGCRAGVEFKSLSAKGLYSGFAVPKWTDVGLKAATIFTGSYRDASFIHLNAGIGLAGNSSHSSLFHFNAGIEASMLSHGVNSHWLYNEGFLAGTETAFRASDIVNNGTMCHAVSSFIEADNFINKDKAAFSGSNAIVKVGSMQQDGELCLETSSLQMTNLHNTGVISLNKCGGEITHFEGKETAITSIENSTLIGKTFDDSGSLELKNTFFNYEDHFDVVKAHSTNVTINTGAFTNKGNWEYEETLIVHAQKAVISENARINGQKTNDNELFVEKEKQPSEVGNTNDAKEEKAFNPKHLFILNADEAVIDGQLSGGDYTQIRGVQPEKVKGSTAEVEIKKSHELSFGDKAQIDLRYGSLQTENLINNGQVQLDSFSFDIDHLSQNGHLSIQESSGIIAQIEDTNNANTVISQSTLKGDQAKFEGKFDASNSFFNYQSSFELQNKGKAHTDNVTITTTMFRDAGELQYENYLRINANTAVIETAGLINGAKTSEDQLFQDKPKEGSVEATEISDKPPEENKEPEKEFKPQHILVINTDKLKIDGGLSGGDYTKVNGVVIEQNESPDQIKDLPVSKCSAIEVGDTATINLSYGSIASKHLEVSGNVQLNSFDLDIDHTKTNTNGHLELNKVKLTGVDLVNLGESKLTSTNVEMASKIIFEKNAHEKLENVTFKTGQFIDHSQMSAQGQVIIRADSYKHDGKIVATKSEKEGATANQLYVESKTGQLEGQAAVDSAVYNIESFNDAERFLRGDGQYSNYQFSTTLGVETDKVIYLDGQINRDCGLMVKGKAVIANIDYATKQDLTFISTEGDIRLSGHYQANNIYGKSEAGIYSNASISGNDLIHLEAKEDFETVGILNSDTVAVSAKSIKNIKALINGRSDVYLDAKGGNIENHGGLIRGGKYTQLTAAGDVLNLCNIGCHWNGYSWVYDFDGGLIAGGTGENTNDVGLYIKAGGLVYSDASKFVSDGINYIEGDRGLYFGARQQTYIAYQEISKHGKVKETAYVTAVTPTTIYSAKGVNILKTEHGGVTSVATQFSSPGGTLIQSRDDVKLYDLKTVNTTYHSKSKLWGLNKSSHYEYHEDLTPTVFADNGLTRIVSTEGTVDARGALFVGAGDLEIEAKHRIKLGCDILNHEVTDKKQSLGVSMLGLPAYNTMKSGGNWIDAASAEDATVAKINRLAHSGNSAEILANASNLGIDLYNTSNSVMRGVANDTVSNEMLARYGLGGADGFSPTITLSMTKSTTTTDYQTLGSTGIDRGGNVKLKAGDGIDLENGVRVHAGGDIDIDAPELIARSAKLHSTFDEKIQTASMNLAAMEVQGGSYSQSTNHAQTINHVNAELFAGGNLHLHHGDGAMQSVVLDGGNIACKTLDADIEHLTIITKQDKTQSNTSSFSASTNGQLSFYTGDSYSKITNQISGIHVEEGINNNGHKVHIGEAYMEGGKITTNGKNNIVIDHLTTVEQHDEAHTSGFGLSLNINDLGRLAGRQSTNETGEQAIAVGEFAYDHVNYQATQTPVIHGEKGTNITIGQLDGKIHTSSANGCKVTKNEEIHLVLDIPITNKSYLDSASQNFKAGAEKIKQIVEKYNPVDASEEKKVNEINPVERVEEKETMMSDEDLAYLFEAFEEYKLLQDYENENVEISMQNPDDRETLKSGKEVVEKKDLGNGEKLTVGQQLEEKAKGVAVAIINAQDADRKDKENKTETSGDKSKAAKKQVMILIKEYIATAFSLCEVKEFIKRYAVLTNVTLNLIGASIDQKEQIIQKAIVQSGSDFVLAKVLSNLGKWGSSIGWGLVFVSVIDALCYNEKRVANTLNNGVSSLNSSQRLFSEGKFLEGHYALMGASMNIEAGTRVQGAHMLIDFINHAFERGVDKVRNVKFELPRSRPFVQKNISSDNNRFFTPKNNELKKKHNEEKEEIIRSNLG